VNWTGSISVIGQARRKWQRTARQCIHIGDASIDRLRRQIGRACRQKAQIPWQQSIVSVLGGLDRRAATAFSFYLAIPTLGAATIVDLLTSLGGVHAADLGRLFLGAVVSMIVAWLSIGWLLRYVAHNTFVAFGIYRILAGLAIFALIAAHVL